MDKKYLNYLTPALLAILLFFSNFLSTDLFKLGLLNFAVWFIVSVFAFACGWFINKTLGWSYGGKIIFAVIISTSLISIIMVSLFSDYFGINDLLTENIILFMLRNIILGSMGFFGMSVCEIFVLQKAMISEKQKSENLERSTVNLEKEAELILKEAKVNAERIVLDAEKKSKNLLDKKERIETQLRKFINTEKELLKKYEEPDN